MSRKYYDILDITKFVLSFFIVAIHAEGLPMFLYPWLRVAVPCFFVISSFLFFSKVNSIGDSAKKTSALKAFVKRNLILYAVWFIILIPFTIFERSEWFNSGIITGILRFLRALVFGSTFRASWYIIASIIAVTLIYFLSKKINIFFLFVFGVITYGLCCLVTGYLGLIKNTGLYIVYDISELLFDSAATSFLHALVWVCIGKAFADNKINLSLPISAMGFVLSCTLLVLEQWYVVNMLDADFSNSCYLALIPLVGFMFDLLIRIKVRIKHSSLLRNLSTIIYVSHCAVLTIYSFVFIKVFESKNGIIIYLLTCVSISIAGIILVKLSSYKRFKFLTYLW